MKQEIKSLIALALERLEQSGAITAIPPADAIQVEHARDGRHGDFSCNVAMVFAKEAGMPPREFARRIVSALPDSPRVERAEVAGPGFVNFFLKRGVLSDCVRNALAEGEAFGRSRIGAGRSVQIEFVSANPTGPLHIGHGRGAAYGAALANLLAAAGYRVQREYYVNDAGRQMDILALSIWLRYLQRSGHDLAFPQGAYRGSYVTDIAAELWRRYGDDFRVAEEDLPEPMASPDDPESTLDTLVAHARRVLAEGRYRQVFDFGLNAVLASIRRDLDDFGIHYDRWYSERSLAESGALTRLIDKLVAQGAVYERDGAKWFRTAAFGDEKDRVVQRENGQTTYFASDIAYHLDKFDRGFDEVIDVWGADHHGYIGRMKAALAAMGLDPDRLEILLVQFATLYRGAERVQMSTRSGEFVTLAELCEEVGRDAARFFYVMRKSDQHLDFDLELAKSRTSDNPVYYIQYAHARIASVLRQLEERGLGWNRNAGIENLRRLEEPEEQSVIAALSRYPDVIEKAALGREPHLLAHYLRELANEFHVYYNAHKVIVDDAPLRDARLSLVAAVARVIRSGLAILGVEAPERM
jgi:arginyl-tRNA synthetase